MDDLKARTKAYLRQFKWYNRDIDEFYDLVLKREAAQFGDIDWAKMDANLFVSFINMELVRFGRITFCINSNMKLPVGVREMIDAEQNAWRNER